MGKYVKVLFMMSIPALLLASGDNEFAQKYFELTGRHTDIVPRVFNFILLVGLLYYLLANPLKKFLKDWTESIANELQEIEAKRQAAKAEREQAQKALEEAKVKAVEIVEDAKKEASLLKEKIENSAKNELVALEKLFNDKCEIERRKSLRETTLGVLDENISSDDIPLDADKIINIVTKEVA